MIKGLNMKKFIFMASLIITGFVIQTSLMGFFNFFNVIPNISLILLVIFAMLTDGVSGGTLGLLTGILYDAMIYDIFGLYALIYFLTGAVIGTISDEMLRENQLVYSLAAGLSTIVMHLLLYLILFFLRFRVQSAHGLLPSILVETILNAVLVVFVLRFFIYLSDRFNVKV